MSAKSPELDYGRADDQMRIGEEALMSADTPQDTANTIPNEIQPITIRQDSDRAEWDRQDTNYPKTSAQIRRKIGGTLLTAEDIEQQDLEEAAAARRIIRANSQQKPKRPRRATRAGRGGDREIPAHERLYVDGKAPTQPDLDDQPDEVA